MKPQIVKSTVAFLKGLSHKRVFSPVSFSPRIKPTNPGKQYKDIDRYTSQVDQLHIGDKPIPPVMTGILTMGIYIYIHPKDGVCIPLPQGPTMGS